MAKGSSDWADFRGGGGERDLGAEKVELVEKGDNLVGREPRKPIKIRGGELGGSVAGSGGGDSEEEGANWDVGFT